MTVHICPYSCSRCDDTCPCNCHYILLREYDADGALCYEETVCEHEFTRLEVTE